jgi:hypothetical protein
MNHLTITATPANVWKADDGTLLARIHFEPERYVVLKLKNTEQAAFLAANLGKTLDLTFEPQEG